MNHERIAHLILARLPTDVTCVNTPYINSLVRQHTRKEKDFIAVKKIIKQKRKRY